MERKNILWLTSWYPNKDDPFDGDFIQRHAKAAAVCNNIHVVFVIASNENSESYTHDVDQPELTEQIIYFRNKPGLFAQAYKHVQWKKLFIKAVEAYIRNHGLPHLVHVHVPWKAGLIALYLKKRHNLPFVITEHWGIYNKVVDDNFFSRSPIVQRLVKRIFSGSRELISVSKYLGESINTSVVKKGYRIIPNVVDTSKFYLKKEKQNRVFTFIHVSNMVALKNVKGIIDAFYTLTQNVQQEVQLIFVGNKNDRYSLYADKLGLRGKQVFFWGEVSYKEVAQCMQQSHCFVLNSTIENSPCTISEALCCGLPVITTAVGGTPELVNETNGLLIPASNTAALTAAMQQVMENFSSYDCSQIAVAASEKYGRAAIAEKFRDLYAAQ